MLLMKPADDISLQEAFQAASELPPREQKLLAEALMAMLASRHAAGLTETQRRIVQERLAKSRSHASEQEVLALLRQYDPSV